MKPAKTVLNVPMVFKAHHNNSAKRSRQKRPIDLGRSPIVAALRAITGEGITAAKPFTDIDEPARRVPVARKTEGKCLRVMAVMNGFDAQHFADATLLYRGGCVDYR